MNQNNYLIPANTKSGALIFSIFTWFDIALFGSGVFISLILLFILNIDQTVLALVALTPGLICSFLVIPIPNYHNILTVITSAFGFFTERRVFLWKGWCVNGEDEQK